MKGIRFEMCELTFERDVLMNEFRCMPVCMQFEEVMGPSTLANKLEKQDIEH